MGVMNKLMNFLGLQEEEEVFERERYENSRDDDDSESQSSELRKNKGNVVSIHSAKHMRMFLCEPRSYEEAQQIADHLRSRRPAVINLQRVRSDQAVRIIDFLSGTVYALNGSISKVGANIFLCTPDSVEIHGTITDMFDEER